jgi:flagella basal body P-ring formation protein FlgA
LPACARTGDQISVLAALGGLTVRMQAKALARAARRPDRKAGQDSKRRILVKLVNRKSRHQVPAGR